MLGDRPHYIALRQDADDAVIGAEDNDGTDPSLSEQLYRRGKICVRLDRGDHISALPYGEQFCQAAGFAAALNSATYKTTGAGGAWGSFSQVTNPLRNAFSAVAASGQIWTLISVGPEASYWRKCLSSG